MKLIKIILCTTVARIFCQNWRKIVVEQAQVIPKIVTTLIGNSVRTHCGSLSPVEWTVGEHFLPLPNQHTANNNSLTLNNVGQSESGLYFCKGTYKNFLQQIKKFKNYFFLGVFEVAEIGSVCPNFLEVSEGSNATLTCGSLKQTEWFSKDIYSQLKTIIGNTLILHNLTKELSGQYICRGMEKESPDEPMIIFHDKAVVIVDGYVEMINTFRHVFK